MAIFCLVANFVYCCVQLRKRQRARMVAVEPPPQPQHQSLPPPSPVSPHGGPSSPNGNNNKSINGHANNGDTKQASSAITTSAATSSSEPIGNAVIALPPPSSSPSVTLPSAPTIVPVNGRASSMAGASQPAPPVPTTVYVGPKGPVLGFAHAPDELGMRQKHYIGVFALLLLIGFVICVAIFGGKKNFSSISSVAPTDGDGIFTSR